MTHCEASKEFVEKVQSAGAKDAEYKGFPGEFAEASLRLDESITDPHSLHTGFYVCIAFSAAAPFPLLTFAC